jgi:hypothetical protein
MFRRISSLLLMVLVAGCGREDVPAVAQQPLAPAQPAAREPTGLVDDLPFEVVEARPTFRSQSLLPAAQPEVRAHSLAVADGTQVEFMLGVVSCGMMVVAQGTASVHGGRFEIPFDDAAANGFTTVSLYFRVVPEGGAACDETAQVLEAEVALPGSVDLSQAQQTYGGCWLFGATP